MPKLVYNPVDRRPPPPMSAMAVKVAGMVVMCVSLVGIAYMLQRFSGDPAHEPWSWNPANIRFNFDPILTPQQVNQLLHRGVAQANAEMVKGSHTQAPPAGNDPGGVVVPPVGEIPRADAPPPVPDRDAHELRLAQAQLTRAPAFDIAEHTRASLDFEAFRDDDQTRCMQEFDANQGRQAPPNERLALGLLHKLPGVPDYAQKVSRGVNFFGRSMAAIEQYRGHAVGVEGRLFDLYEIKTGPAYTMADGSKVAAYYEGVVVTLGKGDGYNEQPIEQRTVIFQCLSLPDTLKPYLNDTGSISHDDKLSAEAVMVSLSGVYLRRWIYSRTVAPFSTKAKAETSQAIAPLLLTADIALSKAGQYELTDELLQQVRDSIRQEPIYLETEAAYYAMLARSRDPQDAFSPVEGIGYFDLVGSRGETGPRYRGQGLHVNGMIGDDYAPVIFPPNVSGLRRVFRALVLGDTADANSDKRYLVDMIEPPTGLEPRALVSFDARYYRNVFEVRSTSSKIAPLLIVRKLAPITRAGEENEWVYGLVAIGAFVLICGVVVFFVFSDRRERRRFEAVSMEVARKRLEKRGGFKLKPLPGDKPRDNQGNSSSS